MGLYPRVWGRNTLEPVIGWTKRPIGQKKSRLSRWPFGLDFLTPDWIKSR